MKRVVVTGAGAVSALGNDWATVRERLAAGRSEEHTSELQSH